MSVTVVARVIANRAMGVKSQGDCGRESERDARRMVRVKDEDGGEGSGDMRSGVVRVW